MEYIKNNHEIAKKYQMTKDDQIYYYLKEEFNL